MVGILYSLTHLLGLQAQPLHSVTHIFLERFLQLKAVPVVPIPRVIMQKSVQLLDFFHLFLCLKIRREVVKIILL